MHVQFLKQKAIHEHVEWMLVKSDQSFSLSDRKQKPTEKREIQDCRVYRNKAREMVIFRSVSSLADSLFWFLFDLQAEDFEAEVPEKQKKEKAAKAEVVQYYGLLFSCSALIFVNFVFRALFS